MNHCLRDGEEMGYLFHVPGNLLGLWVHLTPGLFSKVQVKVMGF